MTFKYTFYDEQDMEYEYEPKRAEINQAVAVALADNCTPKNEDYVKFLKAYEAMTKCIDDSIIDEIAERFEDDLRDYFEDDAREAYDAGFSS